jgi:hypothetical protein
MAEGAIIAGAGLQAYGQYESARQQAEAARMEARMKRQQSKEILERLVLQEQSLEQTARATIAAQEGAFAKGGVALGEGMTLIAMEDTNAKINQEIDNLRRDAKFRSTQLLQGAKFEEEAAGQIMQAGTISAGATLLGAASNYKR